MKYRTFLTASGAPDGSMTRRAFKAYLEQARAVGPVEPPRVPLSQFIAMYWRPGRGGWKLPEAAR